MIALEVSLEIYVLKWLITLSEFPFNKKIIFPYPYYTISFKLIAQCLEMPLKPILKYTFSFSFEGIKRILVVYAAFKRILALLLSLIIAVSLF